MRLFLISLAFLSAGAQAASYDLTDEAILGLYKLERADRNSEIKSAELIYNEDNTLVVMVDRNDSEYELSGPDRNGVVYEGEDEPNCGGEEQKCWYDSSTVIKLKKVKVDGEQIPQLEIKITQSNAWDEEGKDDETITYVLNWNKKLAHAIPFYVNIESPPALDRLVKQCNRVLEDLEYEDGAGYLNANDVCPYPRSVQLREPFAKSLKYYVDHLSTGRNGSRPEEVTQAQLKTKVFKKARALAAKYNPKEAKSPTRAEVLDQIDRIEAYVNQADMLYTYPYILDGVIVAVDSKKKTISRFNIKVTDRYPN